MRTLRFLSRLALICNLLFVCCLVMRHSSWKVEEDLASTIIIMGWLMAIVINFSVNLVIAINLLSRKPMEIPKWLMIVNFIFLVVQLIYLFTQPVL